MGIIIDTELQEKVMTSADTPRDPGENPASDIELQVNPDDVCQIIQLARNFHTQEAVVLSNETSDQDRNMSGKASEGYPVDPVRQEFRTIIADMDHRQQIELVALLWMGRGDEPAADWNSLLADAANAWSEHTDQYLLDQPLLADHLTAGLETLGHSCE